MAQQRLNHLNTIRQQITQNYFASKDAAIVIADRSTLMTSFPDVPVIPVVLVVPVIPVVPDVPVRCPGCPYCHDTLYRLSLLS